MAALWPPRTRERAPRLRAEVNRLLGEDVPEKHARPFIGQLKAGAINVEVRPAWVKIAGGYLTPG